MRRFRVIAVLLLLLTLVMAQPVSSSSGQAARAPKPKAEKMASDDVMVLLEKREVFFLDVREPKELVELGTLDGYVNIPLGQIEARLAEIPRDKAVITA